MIVYKKTDEWYINWHRMTMSDNEWQQVLHRMTTSDTEWHRVVQRMTTSDTTSDNQWQRVTASGTASDNEWQWMTASNQKWQWVTANDNEWQKEWILMRVSKIEWFCVSKEKKASLEGQSASWIILQYAIYNYYQNQPFADDFRNRCS